MILGGVLCSVMRIFVTEHTFCSEHIGDCLASKSAMVVEQEERSQEGQGAGMSRNECSGFEGSGVVWAPHVIVRVVG
jgi:hypothetical protein